MGPKRLSARRGDSGRLAEGVGERILEAAAAAVAAPTIQVGERRRKSGGKTSSMSPSSKNSTAKESSRSRAANTTVTKSAIALASDAQSSDTTSHAAEVDFQFQTTHPEKERRDYDDDDVVQYGKGASHFGGEHMEEVHEEWNVNLPDYLAVPVARNLDRRIDLGDRSHHAKSNSPETLLSTLAKGQNSISKSLEDLFALHGDDETSPPNLTPVEELPIVRSKPSSMNVSPEHALIGGRQRLPFERSAAFSCELDFGAPQSATFTATAKVPHNRRKPDSTQFTHSTQREAHTASNFLADQLDRPSSWVVPTQTQQQKQSIPTKKRPASSINRSAPTKTKFTHSSVFTSSSGSQLYPSWMPRRNVVPSTNTQRPQPSRAPVDDIDTFDVDDAVLPQTHSPPPRTVPIPMHTGPPLPSTLATQPHRGVSSPIQAQGRQTRGTLSKKLGSYSWRLQKVCREMDVMENWMSSGDDINMGLNDPRLRSCLIYDVSVLACLPSHHAFQLLLVRIDKVIVNSKSSGKPSTQDDCQGASDPHSENIRASSIDLTEPTPSESLVIFKANNLPTNRPLRHLRLYDPIPMTRDATTSQTLFSFLPTAVLQSGLQHINVLLCTGCWETRENST